MDRLESHQHLKTESIWWEGGGGGEEACVCVCVWGGGNGILSGSYGSLNNKPNRRCVNALLDTDTTETIERVRMNGVPIL